MSEVEGAPDDPYVDPEDTHYFFSETEKYNPDAITNPVWPHPYETLVHDWREYVPDGLKEAWASLSRETKEAVYYMAKEQADNEVWD